MEVTELVFELQELKAKIQKVAVRNVLEIGARHLK